MTKQLDAAVTAGKLSKDQETKVLSGLSSRLDDLVNGAAFPFGHGHGGWKAWNGKDGTPPPPAAPADEPAPAPATA